MKSGSFGFMTTVNPGIENSGFFDDSKVKTLNLFPKSMIPITVFSDSEELIMETLWKIEESQIKYPLIIKPDIGERGTEVRKVFTEPELLALLSQIDYSFQIQEFIAYKTELGVFWYRYPEEETGQVTSLTLKNYLQVKGDGRKTIDELILENPRARFQRKRLIDQNQIDLNKVLDKEEVVILNEIGNHSRGTTFINGNHLIDDQLKRTMDEIMKDVEGVYFGRADIKCESLESLKEMKNFKILEFNGVKAEPTHIYEPSYPLMRGLKELTQNVDIIYKIATQNKKQGYEFPPGLFRAFVRYSRNRKK